MDNAIERDIWRRLAWVLAVCAMCAACLGGCAGGGGRGEAAGASATGLDPVNLIWYYPQYQSNLDQRLVNDAVNEITRTKLNATVDLRPIDFANYEQKLNTIVASGEQMDIIWTSNWLFQWTTNAKKGVFQPIDELLGQYGGQLLASMDEKYWNGGKLGGKQYAIPNYQISAMRPSLVIQKRFIDKYRLDVFKIKRIEDIEPFLEQIKEGEPDIVPFGTTKGFYTNLLYGIDWIVPVYRNDPTPTVLPDVTPEMRTNFAMMHDWYMKGYINEDAATLKDAAEAYNKGNTAVWFDITGKPGSEVEYKAADGGYDVQLVPLVGSAFVGAGSSMNAIGRTSSHPDRAVMLLNLVNADKALYNLLVYGIEGKHYTKTTGNFIKVNPDGGYFTNTDWVFGDIRGEYLPEGSPPDKIEQTVKANEEAAVSAFEGFEFNADPVKTEIANVRAVNDEYYAALATGTIDPARFLAEYEDKLAKAGAGVIVQEKQKQLDAWLKARGKE
ncbi:putative aldouronate transport system substrate-binding protein [Cohnella sp. OV330]|uniref:ABC transporter substrate-binding protein n=1 Tax=Cohnella sp. OV330 TaxID=1855288 RepID=UPI0008E407EE|nr:ABC transporter substrate-binding protein [Cohnella sp. OV330]SFA73394.1 putative aldouronate transport system substrate-binding protein [Cohnella sp. OV330]